MRWPRTRRTLRWMTVLSLGLLALGTWWLLVNGSRGVTAATVLSLPVSLLILAVAILGIRRESPEDDEKALASSAYALAKDIGTRAAEQQQRFLADAGLPEPANIGFEQPSLVYWRTDGGAQRGSMGDIKEFHASLRRGRLVILGPAGAGKTVLVNQLLLDIVASFNPHSLPQAGCTPVPLRMNLSSLIPSGLLQGAPASETRRRLDRCIASYITEVHGLAPRKARSLIQSGWILPILDGLDEMDGDTEEARRAREIISALNQPVDGSLPAVVVTCRSDRYSELVDMRSRADTQPVLQDATVIHIQPLNVEQIEAYLTYRFPDPSDAKRTQERWRPLLTEIRKRPTGRLAIALSSPLRLFLTVTAYNSAASRPIELRKLPASDLDRYLIDQLVPAITAQHPAPDGRPYNAADVRRWLTTLASFLKVEELALGGRVVTDIMLPQLSMRISGLGRFAAGVLRAEFTALPLALFIIYYRQLYPKFPLSAWSGEFPSSRLLLSGLLATIGGAAFLAARGDSELRRLDLSQLRTRTARKRITAGLAIGLSLGLGLGVGLTGGIVQGLGLGLAAGLAIGIQAWQRYWRANRRLAAFVVGLAVAAGPDLFIGYSLWGVGATWLELTFGLVFGASAGVAAGLGAGLAWGVTQRPNAIGKPSDLISQGALREFAIAASVTLGVGLVLSLQWISGLVSQFWASNISGHAVSAWTVLANVFRFYGFQISTFYIPKAFLLALACGIATSAWSPLLRYFIATRSLAARNALPARPARFLDWACDVGLMRLSGVHAQFRHYELQAHLAQTATRQHGPSLKPYQIDEIATKSPFTTTSRRTRAPKSMRFARRLALVSVVIGIVILASASTPGEISPVAGGDIIPGPPPPPSTATLRSNAAEAVAYYLNALETHDWKLPGIQIFGKPGSRYSLVAQGFAYSRNRAYFITAAAKGRALAYLVGVNTRNQALIYSVRYVANKGLITSMKLVGTIIGPSGNVLLPPFTGTWIAHNGYLSISRHGLGVLSFRTYSWCNMRSERLVPCDSFAGEGGLVVFQLVRERGTHAVGFILAGDYAQSGRVIVNFQPSVDMVDEIQVVTANGQNLGIFCGSYSLPGDCGA